MTSLVLDSAMDTRAITLAQQQRLLDASGLVDAIGRTRLDPHQRILVAAAKRLIREFNAANDLAGECARAIAGAADQALAGPEWSQRRVIRSTRDHLAVLLNPSVIGVQREQSLAAVRYVIEHAPSGMVGSHEDPVRELEHQLGGRKTKMFWDLVAEARP